MAQKLTKKQLEEIQKNISKYPETFRILSVDPSFAGFGWIYSEVNLKDKTFNILQSGTNTSIAKNHKVNKYKALSEYVNGLITELGQVDYVIAEGQFFKSMYMIVGAVAAGIPDGVRFLNLNKKDDRQPKRIRQILAGKKPIRSKDDVRVYLEENMIVPTEWTHDINDACMVLLAYLKTNFGLTLENYNE